MTNLAMIAGYLVAIVVLMSGCAPAGASQRDNTSLITMIIFLVGLFAIFYFLMIRPQRKRQKEHDAVTQSLQKGDRVITIGGMYGQIESIDPNSVVLKVESGATIRLAKDAIAGKLENVK